MSTQTHLLKHLLDTVLCLRADLWPRVGLEVQVAFQYAVEDLLLAFTPERWHTAQQNVQNHSTTPDVSLVAVMPS